MATKAVNQAKINAIADGEENTALEVRDFANGLLNELYPNSITDTQATTNVITKISSLVNYTLTFTKSGNLVVVNGEIIKISPTSSLPNVDLIAFTDAEYFPSDAFNQKFDIGGVVFQINNGKITAINSITNLRPYYFSLTYITS